MKTEELLKLLLSLILFMSLLSIYHFFRLRSDSGLFTYDEYRYITKAEYIINSNYSSDSIRSNLQDPVSILLAFLEDYKLAIRIIPFLFAILNLLLVYALIKKVPMGENHRLYSFIYLLLSPFFIYLHTTFSLGLISLTLMLSGTLFFIDNKPIFGLGFYLLMLWINPWCFFVVASFLIFSFQRMKETKKWFELFALLFILIVFLLLKGFSLPHHESILEMGKDYITDLGSLSGNGIFGVLTVIIGLFLFLRNKENRKDYVWFMLLLVLLSLYDKFYLVFLELFAAYFSGFAILKIIHGKWESGILKNYVTLLIFCGLVFSAGSFLNKSYKYGADYSERISIEWLKNNGDQGKKILSYYDYGYLLSSSGIEPYTDKDYFLYSKERDRINETNRIFMIRDLKRISPFLKNNNIKYIWINDAMKNYLVWDKEDEGILFTLKNSISFKRIYSYLGIDIWEYTPTN
jgi:hypothetical protein